MRIRFSPQATQDLSDIADYLRPRSPGASQLVRASILRSLQNLLLFPDIGREQNVEGVRKLVTRKYRYLVYYTVDQGHDEIIVLAIRHPAREREYTGR